MNQETQSTYQMRLGDILHLIGMLNPCIHRVQTHFAGFEMSELQAIEQEVTDTYEKLYVFFRQLKHNEPTDILELKGVYKRAIKSFDRCLDRISTLLDDLLAAYPSFHGEEIDWLPAYLMTLKNIGIKPLPA